MAEKENNLSFDDAVRIANGCFDYSGGHHTDGHLEAYHHGIQTVCNALEGAKKHGMDDLQVRVLHRLGRAKEGQSKQQNDDAGNAKRVPFEMIGNDLYCTVLCTCDRPLRLQGYNDAYFFDVVQAESHGTRCILCERWIKYQWFRDGVEVSIEG